MSKCPLVGSTFASLAAVTSLGAVLGLSAMGLSACNTAELEGARAEVKDHNIKLDLPAVPAFDMPTPNADGTHPVEEMRLRGKRYLGQTVQIRGFVTRIYDCKTAIRTADMSEKEAQKSLDENPGQCTRPNFYLSGVKKGAIDKGVKVVENPRPPRKDEKKADKEGAKLMQAAFDLVPAFKIDDEVVVTGKWATKSPRGFRDSNGLLVFETLVNVSNPPPPPK